MSTTTKTTVTKGKGNGASTTTTTKTTKNQGSDKKGSGNSRRKNKRGGKIYGTPGNVVLRNHWNMLSDPCHATLSESAYRGRAGFVSRFTQVLSLTGVAETGFYLSAVPGAGAYTAAVVVNSSQVVTPTYATPLPGQVYLLTVCDAARCIGFCADIDYLGTELERSGMLYAGTLPYTTVPNGTGQTIDQLKTLLSNETRCPDVQLKTTWFPGVGNEEYSPLGSVSTSFDADCNNLVILGENLPAGVKIRIRLTIIMEWTPKVTTGLMAPVAVGGTNPPAAYEKLHEAAKHDPTFTQSFMGGATRRAGQYAYAAGGAAMDAAMAMGVGMMTNPMRRTNPIILPG